MEATNQEIKFFSVEIGIETRRGNFIKHHSFVCKTQLDTMDVHKHYREKYYGFAVNVESINKVVSLDEKVEIKKTTPITTKVTTFISKMSFERFSAELRNELNELEKSRREHKALEENAVNKVKKEIKKMNSLIESVNLNDRIPSGFSGGNYVYLPYTANLNGSIIEHTERQTN